MKRPRQQIETLADGTRQKRDSRGFFRKLCKIEGCTRYSCLSQPEGKTTDCCLECAPTHDPKWSQTLKSGAKDTCITPGCASRRVHTMYDGLRTQYCMACSKNTRTTMVRSIQEIAEVRHQGV